jgi:hypothetical protein
MTSRSSGIPRFAARAPDARYITGGWQVVVRSKSAGQVADGGQRGAAGSQKNSHTREFAGDNWYSRPQVGAVPAGAPHAAPSVVQVFVQRFHPCSAPTLTQTNCGVPAIVFVMPRVSPDTGGLASLGAPLSRAFSYVADKK